MRAAQADTSRGWGMWATPFVNEYGGSCALAWIGPIPIS